MIERSMDRNVFFAYMGFLDPDKTYTGHVSINGQTYIVELPIGQRYHWIINYPLPWHRKWIREFKQLFKWIVEDLDFTGLIYRRLYGKR